MITLRKIEIKNFDGCIYLHDISISSYLALTTVVCFYNNDLLIINIPTSHTKLHSSVHEIIYI